MDFKNKKFTRNGEVVDLIQKLDKGSLIYRPLVYYRGEEQFLDFEGPEYYEGELFDLPPTAPKVKTIEQLKEGIASYTAQRNELQKELLSLKLEIAKKEEALKKYPELKRFTDFLEGRLKWIVLDGYSGWTLKPFDHALKLAKGDEYGEKLKLATAFGQSKGDVEFRLDKYSDGSGGSHQRIWPFEKKEDARDFVIGHIESLDKYSSTTFVTAKNFEIELDPVKALAYKEALLETYKKNYKSDNDRYLKRISEQNNLEAEIAALNKQLLK